MIPDGSGRRDSGSAPSFFPAPKGFGISSSDTGAIVVELACASKEEQSTQQEHEQPEGQGCEQQEQPEGQEGHCDQAATATGGRHRSTHPDPDFTAMGLVGNLTVPLQ
jgi:hypothetical protein